MSTQKPSHNEEEFIAREHAMEMHKLAVAKSRAMAESERDRLRREHFMKCPKCGMDLHSLVYRGLTIDRCGSCHGTWLDEGELELLVGRGGDTLSRIAAIFRPTNGPLAGPDR